MPPSSSRPVEVRAIELAFSHALAPPEEGDVLVSFSVTPAGEALGLWASAEEATRLRGRDTRRGGSFPLAMLERPATVRVTLDVFEMPEARQLRTLDEVTVCFPTAHVMPGDQLLLVGARAFYHDGAPDQNAQLFGADGHLTKRACVGDGVQSVATSAAGAIWIGYFDEGVFGNYGWNDPMGAPGLNRFDRELALAWSHPRPGEIADCYALTLTEEDCAICPYTDWEIQRFFAGGHDDRFRNQVAGGAHAMMWSGQHVALVGGYQDDRNRVVLGQLTGDRFAPSAAAGRLTRDGQPLAAAAHLVGRDGVLHVLEEGRWHTLVLWQLLEQLR